MKIEVRFLAQLRQLAGCGRDTISLDASPDITCLLTILAEQLPQLASTLRSPALLVFVNDAQVPREYRLQPTDVVTLMTPIAGGSGELSAAERAMYEWQLWVPGFGEEGQRKLKRSSVLISRCGGVGGLVAYQLAAAGVGRLVLAHAGTLRANDLNRQLLMTYAGIGSLRMDIAPARLRELNPFVEIEAWPENLSPDNAERLVGSVDLVVSCAPLFSERLAMNAAAVRQGKPLVDCAMYELEVQLTTVLPGRSPCLACLCPEPPAVWRREFPVFGAVAGTVGCLGAMEAIKVLTGLGDPLAGTLLVGDLRDMSFRRLQVGRRVGCECCGSLATEQGTGRAT